MDPPSICRASSESSRRHLHSSRGSASQQHRPRTPPYARSSGPLPHNTIHGGISRHHHYAPLEHRMHWSSPPARSSRPRAFSFNNRPQRPPAPCNTSQFLMQEHANEEKERAMMSFGRMITSSESSAFDSISANDDDTEMDLGLGDIPPTYGGVETLLQPPHRSIDASNPRAPFRAFSRVPLQIRSNPLRPVADSGLSGNDSAELANFSLGSSFLASPLPSLPPLTIPPASPKPHGAFLSRDLMSLSHMSPKSHGQNSALADSPSLALSDSASSAFQSTVFHQFGTGTERSDTTDAFNASMTPSFKPLPSRSYIEPVPTSS